MGACLLDTNRLRDASHSLAPIPEETAEQTPSSPHKPQAKNLFDEIKSAIRARKIAEQETTIIQSECRALVCPTASLLHGKSSPVQHTDSSKQAS
jgi:hypothetical protein